MKFRLAVLVLLLAGWVVLPTGATASGPVCGPSSARTLVADREARVYVSADEVYGCAAAGAQGKFLLGRTGSCLAPGGQSSGGAVGPVRIAGDITAYASVVCGVDTGRTTVTVRRLTDGQVLQARSATTTIGVEGHQDVGSLVVKADGSVAWIATAQSIGAPRYVRQLARLDRRGFRVLDSGAAVTAGSLRRRGSTISWQHGTATRTATLD